MSVLRLNVLGPPEVLHDGSRLTFALRKAQALLLYLAVEGGLHPRNKLAALLWPDSESTDALKTLRNALALLRRLLSDTSPAAHSHLLAEQDLLGLDPQAPFELDLDVVQQTWQQVQRYSALPSEEQRAALVTQMQHALSLVRGPFLDGFWLHEETGFDQWVQQQRQQWQMRLPLLFDRLSTWQEAGGELESTRVTLTRWLAFDPLSEEAYRRLMRVHLALGNASAALQVYATCRARLAEELQVKPSADTVALAEHIRANAARSPGSPPPHPAPAESQPPSELLAPLVGRAAAFRQLVGRYQLARGGQPQAVLLLGEAGIGKTRLATEWMAWARAQGAEVLRGHAFEMGGRLPYQLLVEALRPRLEAENAPEDLLENVWLAELSRILPELRMRYPDLPTLTEDELTAKGRFFEAVARLLEALASSGPLVLLLDDLHWADQASLDLVHYLGRYWKEHGSRVMLLGTVRSEALELNPALATQLTDLGRDLPVSQVPLQTLSQAQTLQLVEAIAAVGTQSRRHGSERREHGPAQPSTAGTSPPSERETKLSALSDVLFAQTDGQPLYLLETLKLLRDRQWLVPRLGADGAWRLELAVELETIVAQERSQGALLPPSVRSLILARLAPLSPAARQLVQISAVLATAASAQLLWQLTEMGVQAGVEALEEAVGSGLLREEEAGGPGVGRPGSYRFSHDLMREVVYTELGVARRQVLHQRALARLETEGARASELAYHAWAAGASEAAYGYSVQAGMEAAAIFAVADAIGHYEQARALLQEHQRMQAKLSAWEVERLYVHLGQAYVFLNAWEKAQDAYEELLTYARQKALPTLVCMTLNRLAVQAVQQSHDKAKVRALLEDAWRMAQTSSDQRVLAETIWNRAQIIGVVWGDDFTSSLLDGQQALSLARGIHDQELEGRCLFTLGVIHLFRGDFEETMHWAQASLALYAALGSEPTASGELSLPSFIIGAPLTQPLTHRTSEAMCWALLALAQVHAGQVPGSVRSGRRALALAQESKSVWVQVSSTTYLANGLLEAGAYEEALELMQPTLAQARTLPPTFIYQRFLTALGRTYHAVQQWDEARSTLAEADAIAETLDLRRFRVSPLSQLCMHSALAGEWGQAYRYAVQASSLRKSFEYARILMDFSPQYETEALLREGDERQAREAVHRFGEGVGPYQRYRISYLRSLAVLAAWDGHSEQAIDHLQQAAGLAAEIGLPAEQWQIQVALGRLYETRGEQAHTAFAEAARIIQGLAEGIKDETLRSRFLAGPQIHPVVQRVTGEGRRL